MLNAMRLLTDLQQNP